MWELYAFWTFVPALVLVALRGQGTWGPVVSRLSFAIIAAGGPACVAAGLLARRMGARRVASWALAGSGLCCLIVPWCFGRLPVVALLILLLLWGMAVVADSPLFSSMVAAASPPETRGTALTLVNCIGFSVTIAGIQSMNILFDHWNSPAVFAVLALGPAAGLAALAVYREDDNKRTGERSDR